MGSGCNQNNGQSKCFEIVSDKCVKYTGDSIELLGICNGDMLNEIETIILEKILDILNELDLSTIDLTCAFVQDQMVGKNKDLFTLIQVLIDSSCTLKELVQTLDDQVNQAVSFDLKCITQTTDSIPGTIQGLINMVCDMKEDLDNITDQLNDQGDITTTIKNVAGNLLHSNLTSCNNYGLIKAGSGETSTVSFYGFVPPRCPIPCFAPLSNFDSTGVGLTNTAYCGWYICNGNNGTPDMRGYTFGGAVNLPGIFAANPLDNAVDPLVQGAPYSTSISDKKGTVKETLSISQMPAHDHDVIESGHTHGIQITKPTGTSAGALPAVAGADSLDTSHINFVPTDVSYANPEIQSKGGSQAHNNLQPTIFGYYIIRF